MDSTVKPIAAGNGHRICQRLIGLQPPLPAPVAPPAPAPAAAVAPEPEPEPQVAPKREEPVIEMVARVYARLTTGERIEIASFPELLEARQRAEEVVRDLKAERPEWP